MATSKNTTNKVRLSRSMIDRFECPEGQKESYLWDSTQTGLGVRAYASGKKSFVFRATVNGKTTKGVIFDASGDLAKARAKVRDLLSLASEGVTPTEHKKQITAQKVAAKNESKRQQVTLSEVWTYYLKANKQHWTERHYTDHLKAIQEPGLPCGRGLKLRTKAGAIWALKDETLTNLTAQRIQQWLKKESETRKGVAALSYRLLFACLNWSTEQNEYAGLVDISSLKTRQVKKAVPKMQTRSGCLEREQLKNWFTEMRKISNPVISAFAQTLLITGARRGELEHLKWADVDFQWYSLTIRDKATTNGNEAGTRIIPLTPYVCALLKALPRRNQWVFSSTTSQSGRMTEPRKSIDPALLAAGLEGLTLHDLRRSFATLSEWIEVPSGITAQIMGHKASAIVEKHYKRRPLDLLREWHRNIEKWMLEQAEIVQPEYETGRLVRVK
jgi:integrase